MPEDRRRPAGALMLAAVAATALVAGCVTSEKSRYLRHLSARVAPERSVDRVAIHADASLPALGVLPTAERPREGR